MKKKQTKTDIAIYQAKNGAIELRKWATKTLRQYITKGYTINPKVIKNNYAEFYYAARGFRGSLRI